VSFTVSNRADYRADIVASTIGTLRYQIQVSFTYTGCSGLNAPVVQNAGTFDIIAQGNPVAVISPASPTLRFSQAFVQLQASLSQNPGLVSTAGLS
jgi:hypothetical protein